jgi:hypothetical protein
MTTTLLCILRAPIVWISVWEEERALLLVSVAAAARERAEALERRVRPM